MSKTVSQIIIIDESGSMSGQEAVIIGGFNEQLQTMKKEEQEDGVSYLVTLWKFSDKAVKLIDERPLTAIEPLTSTSYKPDAGTALFDCIGAAISCAEVGQRDTNVMIMTDGQENASKTWTRDQIKMLIELRQNENKWGFTYLGANQDAILAAQQMGIYAANAATYTMGNMGSALNVSSAVRGAYNQKVKSRSFDSMDDLMAKVDKKGLVDDKS